MCGRRQAGRDGNLSCGREGWGEGKERLPVIGEPMSNWAP